MKEYKPYQQLIAYLTALPPNADVIWAGAFWPGRPWAHAMADLHIPQAMDKVDVNWIWTIVPDAEDKTKPKEGFAKFVLNIPYNAELVFHVKDRDVASQVIQQGDALTTLHTDSEQESALFYAHDKNRAPALDKSCDMIAYVLPIWTTDRVNDEIKQWVTQHAKRTDLNIACDLEAEPNPFIAETLKSIKEEEARFALQAAKGLTGDGQEHPVEKFYPFAKRMMELSDKARKREEVIFYCTGCGTSMHGGEPDETPICRCKTAMTCVTWADVKDV
jgi:hypothetical protein